MTPRTSKLREIVAGAARRNGDELRSFIENACDGDDGLLREARELIEADRRFGEVIESAADASEAAFGDLFESPRDAVALPDRLGGYVIEALICERRLTAVYRARSESTGEVVAIKAFRSRLASRDVRRRFAEEVRALRMFRHDGIAAFREFGVAAPPDGRPYVVMEFVPGIPITTYAAKHGLSLRHTASLLAMVCEAVDAAHGYGFIHRDLKPDNILVPDVAPTAGVMPRPKILDFGVAKAMTRGTSIAATTQPGELVGTFAYMSPEQASDAFGPVSVRTDVYAIGSILYELVSGRSPIASDDDQPALSVLKRLTDDEPTRLSRLNPASAGDLEVIAHKALEKNPAARYKTAQELASDLRAFAVGDPISARPRGAWCSARRWVSRHRTASALIAGAAAVLLVSGAWVIQGRWEAEQRLSSSRDTIVFLLDHVDQLSRAPGMRDLRRRMLSEVLEHVREVTDRYGHDDTVLRQRARLLDLMGDWELERLDVPAAERLRREALAAWEHVYNADMSDLDAGASYSLAIVRHADVVARTASREAASALYARALELDRTLVARAPARTHLLDNLTWSFERAFYPAVSDEPRAMAIAQEWRESAERLVAMDPSRDTSYLTLSAVHRAYAYFFLSAKHPALEEAHRHSELAVEFARRAFDAAPEDRWYAALFGLALGMRVQTALAISDTASFRASVDESYRVAESLLAIDPREAYLVWPLSTVIRTSLDEYIRAGDWAAAEQSAARFVKLHSQALELNPADVELQTGLETAQRYERQIMLHRTSQNEPVSAR